MQIDESEFVRWLFEHAAERGVDPGRIALSREAPATNIICVIALRLRNEGGPRLALQTLLYSEAEMPFVTKAAIKGRVSHTSVNVSADGRRRTRLFDNATHPSTR